MAGRADAAVPVAWQAARRARIEAALDRFLPPAGQAPARLHAAMRYSVLGPGKRVRPLLVYAAAEAVGVGPERVDAAAAAVELIHAYSLIHDDLPAMDNDDLRRGRPTCHRAFDEATAMLAGDALQVLAFELLAADPDLGVTPEVRVRMIAALARASGTRGMAGGQALDLAAVGHAVDLGYVEAMHRYKTGALIAVSVRLGALAGPPLAPAVERAFAGYGEALGLAFQIVDDLLDIEGDPALLGKATGADASRRKPTHPAVAGIEAARQRADALTDEALAALAPLGAEAAMLRTLAGELTERRR